MEDVKKIVASVKTAMLKTLSSFAVAGLDEANMAIVNQSIARASNSQSLYQEKQAIIDRFDANLAKNFDQLVGEVDREVNVLDYGSLSLVGEEDLEAIIAMEGMIAHARNCDIQQYLKFTTRLDSLFYGTRIDESNNPMDPEQIGGAFKEAMRPIGLNSAEILIAYRSFNNNVFHKLEEALSEANEILIEYSVIPNLDMAARSKQSQENKRSKPRKKSDPTERAFSSEDVKGGGTAPTNQQLFSMVQGLMHGSATATMPQTGQGTAMSGSATATADGLQAGMMVGGQKVQMVANDQLMTLLGNLQAANVSASENADAEEGASHADVNLTESIAKVLEQGSSSDVLQAIDGQSSDIINLVTLLYDAIWHDETVPIPVKELIGRTQITTLKIALGDAHFFDREDHPARLLINELATAGISWTDFEMLGQDPMYRKMQQLVTEFVDGYADDEGIIEPLLENFRTFKREQLVASDAAAERLKDADERQNRLDDVSAYALEKITDRILDDDLSPSVREFLETLFHGFVVKVILREGPGGVSWKPVMNTIDVLLWTVQSERTEADLPRFVKVNPRLMVNLGKALEVAEVDKQSAKEALERLNRVQEACFKAGKPESADKNSGEKHGSDKKGTKDSADEALEILKDGDEHLVEVSKYPIGIWLEFQLDGQQTIRCTLAAKIDTIEKYMFVNSQGVKVVEKSRMGLARELKAGTVKVISEAPLIDRAMESVIGKLRDDRADK